MLFVLLLVAVDPDVLPLEAPDVLVSPAASAPPGCAVVVPAVLPVVPDAPPVVPAVLLLVPVGAAVVPGRTMAPPLAPSAPVVVAPWPAVTLLSLESVPLLDAEAPDACAYAPLARKPATRMPRSLLMLGSP